MKHHLAGSNYMLLVMAVLSLAVAFGAVLSLTYTYSALSSLNEVQNDVYNLRTELLNLRASASPKPTASATPEQ